LKSPAACQSAKLAGTSFTAANEITKVGGNAACRTAAMAMLAPSRAARSAIASPMAEGSIAAISARCLRMRDHFYIAQDQPQ